MEIVNKDPVRDVSQDGRRMAIAIVELLEREGIDPDDALQALMCVTASIIGQEDDRIDKVKWLMGNLRRLTQSFHRSVQGLSRTVQ